jgi:hypothetical protein
MAGSFGSIAGSNDNRAPSLLPMVVPFDYLHFTSKEEPLITGISQAEKTGQHFFDAEMYRLRGELKHLEGSPNLKFEARQCFERAIEIVAYRTESVWNYEQR